MIFLGFFLIALGMFDLDFGLALLATFGASPLLYLIWVATTIEDAGRRW